MTPVRTTNGATPRSSRAYQRRRSLSARPGGGFAFDAYEESRSSSPPWCRRRPALLEDDEGSLSRGPEEKQYDYYGISYDATERGAAWTAAEDRGTTPGASQDAGLQRWIATPGHELIAAGQLILAGPFDGDRLGVC